MVRRFLPVVLVLVVSLLAVSSTRASENETGGTSSLEVGASGCSASGVTTSAPGALLALAALAGTLLFLARWGRCERPRAIDRRLQRRRGR